MRNNTSTWTVGIIAMLLIANSHAFNIFGKKEEEKPLRTGYTCCNLHYEGDWISDANWGAQPFVPAGSPVKVKGYGRHRVHVEIDGKPMRLGLDYGRQQETLEGFAEKIVVEEDPKPKIAKFPSEIREAIRLGQVMAGMTKEQAIIAIGYPQSDMTVSLDAAVWNHWASSFGGYQLIWGKNGRIKEITGDSTTLARMVYRKAD